MAVETYEQVPYTSKPYAYATASRMAVVARLFGMQPADPTTARVLEIGCAGGGNLIPRALAHPRATFLGIDPAERHVRQAQQLIYALGLENVRVERRGVEDLTAEDGPFDYIVAHGVFSWIPAELRLELLAACKRLLAPNGVAYVSYNTLPGWHLRRTVRDAMLFHAEQFEDPRERIQQARAMLGFLADSTSPAQAGPWARLLQAERDMLATAGDDYLFHDHLSPDNDPVYFHEFVRLAGERGLGWLGEAEFHRMMTLALPPDIREVLERISGDLVRVQQYMDFVLNRGFRHSLLVHDDVELDRQISWTTMEELWLTSPLRTADRGAPDLKGGVPVTFSDGEERSLTSDEPSVKAGFAVLQEEAPRPLSFRQWTEATRTRLVDAGASVPEDLDALLGRNALYAYAQGLIRLWPHDVATGGADAEFPAAFPFARLQAAARMPWVTSRFHLGVRVDELDRILLTACDGQRDREALRAVLIDAVDSGRLVLEQDDGNDVPPERARSDVLGELEDRLHTLGRVGLLAVETP